MKAVWNNAVIAESDETVVVEGNHYFPLESVRQEFLTPSDTHSTCPWKGIASYYSLEVGGETNKDAVVVLPRAERRRERDQGPGRLLERREGFGVAISPGHHSRGFFQSLSIRMERLGEVRRSFGLVYIPDVFNRCRLNQSCISSKATARVFIRGLKHLRNLSAMSACQAMYSGHRSRFSGSEFRR